VKQLFSSSCFLLKEVAFKHFASGKGKSQKSKFAAESGFSLEFYVHPAAKDNKADGEFQHDGRENRPATRHNPSLPWIDQRFPAKEANLSQKFSGW